MIKLKKLKIWITIVLLICFTTSLRVNAANPSTGEVVNRNDSVLISYDDLRKANSKLIELEYEKKINTRLKEVISNDSIIISNYSNLNNTLNKSYKKTIKQRNVCFGVAIIGILTSIIL